MSTPAQMFDHRLNGVKGFIPASPWLCDKVVELDDSVTVTDVKAGMVVSMNTDGKFILGVGTPTAVYAPMPFIVFQNGDDFDVLGDDGNITGASSTYAQTSRIMGLAVNTAAEVETTEFDDDTYVPGDLLSAGTDGKIEIVAVAGTIQTVLGVVSDGVLDAVHGDRAGDNTISVLRFHTVYQIRFAS